MVCAPMQELSGRGGGGGECRDWDRAVEHVHSNRLTGDHGLREVGDASLQCGGCTWGPIWDDLVGGTKPQLASLGRSNAELDLQLAGECRETIWMDIEISSGKLLSRLPADVDVRPEAKSFRLVLVIS